MIRGCRCASQMEFLSAAYHERWVVLHQSDIDLDGLIMCEVMMVMLRGSGCQFEIINVSSMLSTSYVLQINAFKFNGSSWVARINEAICVFFS